MDEPTYTVTLPLWLYKTLLVALKTEPVKSEGFEALKNLLEDTEPDKKF